MELKAEGAVLGQFPNWLYQQSERQLELGDRLLLFTDGLVEACNPEEEFFSEHNLVRIAQEHPKSSAGELLGRLMHAASQHCGDHFQDDASMIVLKTSCCCANSKVGTQQI
jgi:sigma-B regulation protein RsbU (phosphoserine phosphatase)